MRKLLVLVAWFGSERMVHACGCLAPPDPTVPVVQAAEQIAFAMKDGQVTAHIQIRYAGPAPDFGWLLPLPSLPTLELGSDELFAKLQATTAPRYNLTQIYEGNCQQSFASASPDMGLAPADGGVNGAPSPVAFQDSIGPYDYAVLHADSKDEMLKWLADNHYFVPVGTSDVVDAYIHPGAYFLALKLRSGQSAGDLMPVVVRYQSDLPMIPIILTSVGAQQNMGIYVWILGDMRAVPRNYYHTVINDALVNWGSPYNYTSVVTQAVAEAPKKHSFVTDYAGTSSIMKDKIYYKGRFGTLVALKASPNADSFLEYIATHDFPYTSSLLAILERYFPVPDQLTQIGLTPGQFYYNITTWRLRYPDAFIGWTPNYVPNEIADQIDQRVIQPTIQASALFDDHPYLTRLFTTISPEDMTEDPVFSFNSQLTDVSNNHNATLTIHCGDNFGTIFNSPATLVTEQGWVVQYPNGFYNGASSASLPAAERTEAISDDSVTIISEHVPQPPLAGGCSVAFTGTSTGAGLLLVLLVFLRRRPKAS
jgi:MYXO-CTERM domain-containing protein